MVEDYIGRRTAYIGGPVIITDKARQCDCLFDKMSNVVRN
jgi:hypothetical protein